MNDARIKSQILSVLPFEITMINMIYGRILEYDGKEKLKILRYKLNSISKLRSNLLKILEYKSDDLTSLEEQLLKSFDSYIKLNKEKILIYEEKIKSYKKFYYLFQNKNLFITSLVLYSLLENRENEDCITRMVDNSKSDDEKLVHLINKIISNPQKVSNLYFGESAVEALGNDLMPNYSTEKKISGYRADLKRTLLKGKDIKFKNEMTLKKIAKLFSGEDGDSLMKVLTDTRYSYLVYERGLNLELFLSDNESSLMLNISSEDELHEKILIKNLHPPYISENIF